MTEDNKETLNKNEELPPLKVEITKQVKQKPYDGEESYLYDTNLNPSEQELEEDFDGT